MNNKKKNSFFILFLFFIACFLFVFIAEADARAGGGSTKNSSIRSSSTSSHNSKTKVTTESGYNIKLHFKRVVKLLPLHLIALCILIYRGRDVRNSYIFLKPSNLITLSCMITIIVVIYPFAVFFDIAIFVWSIRVLIKFKRLVGIHYEFSFESRQKTEMAVSAIKQIHSDFNLDLFRDKIKQDFINIKNSWSNQDLLPVRYCLADGTYDQLQIQLNNMKNNNLIDIIKDIKMYSIEIEKYEVSTYYESVYVYIIADTINYLFDKNKNEIIKGSKDEIDSFAELWCLSKRKNDNFINEKGIIDGFCPNCSAKIENTQDDKCKSCGAKLIGGDLDWVLAGIHSPIYWNEVHNSEIPGLKNLIICDPYFSIQNIEDRLSSMFWRLNEAERTKSAEPIEKIANNEFIFKFTQSNYNCKIPLITKNQTDSINVIGIFKENNKHYILGQIIWNTRYYSSHSSASGSHRHQDKILFVLARDKNAKTENCFCSSNYSESCNNYLDSEPQDWILAEILNPYDSKAKDYIDKAKKYDLEKEYI